MPIGNGYTIQVSLGNILKHEPLITCHPHFHRGVVTTEKKIAAFLIVRFWKQDDPRHLTDESIRTMSVTLTSRFTKS